MVLLLKTSRPYMGFWLKDNIRKISLWFISTIAHKAVLPCIYKQPSKTLKKSLTASLKELWATSSFKTYMVVNFYLKYFVWEYGFLLKTIGFFSKNVKTVSLVTLEIPYFLAFLRWGFRFFKRIVFLWFCLTCYTHSVKLGQYFWKVTNFCF